MKNTLIAIAIGCSIEANGLRVFLNRMQPPEGPKTGFDELLKDFQELSEEVHRQRWSSDDPLQTDDEAFDDKQDKLVIMMNEAIESESSGKSAKTIQEQVDQVNLQLEHEMNNIVQARKNFKKEVLAAEKARENSKKELSNALKKAFLAAEKAFFLRKKINYLVKVEFKSFMEEVPSTKKLDKEIEKLREREAALKKEVKIILGKITKDKAIIDTMMHQKKGAEHDIIFKEVTMNIDAIETKELQVNKLKEMIKAASDYSTRAMK